jgi:anti-sigma factor RsiW
MTCRDFQEQLSALFEGELAPLEIPSALAHAAGCRECQNFLALLPESRRLLRSAAQESLPEGLELPVHPSLPALRPLSRLEAIFRRRFSIPAAAAIGSVAVLIALLLTTLSLWTWKVQPTIQKSPRVVYMLEVAPVEVVAENLHRQK